MMRGVSRTNAGNALVGDEIVNVSGERLSNRMMSGFGLKRSWRSCSCGEEVGRANVDL